jgi:hypothetical protein
MELNWNKLSSPELYLKSLVSSGHRCVPNLGLLDHRKIDINKDLQNGKEITSVRIGDTYVICYIDVKMRETSSLNKTKNIGSNTVLESDHRCNIKITDFRVNPTWPSVKPDQRTRLSESIGLEIEGFLDSIFSK